LNNPHNPAKLWQEAVSAYQSGKLKQAGRAIRPLLKHPAANGETWLLGGLINAQLGEWASAEPLLEKAVKQFPDRIDGWLTLGNAHHMLGRMEQAVAAFKQVTDRQPDNADAWNNMGVVNEDMGRFRDALDCYDCSLGVDPNHSMSMRSRASVLGRLRRFDDACSAYDELLRRFSQDQGLIVDYAEFLEQANRPKDAEKILPAIDDIDDLKTRARAQGVSARLLIRDGQLEIALAKLQKTRKQTGEDFLSYHEGTVHDRLGQYEAAMSSFGRANQCRARQRNFRRVAEQPVTKYLNHKIRTGVEDKPHGRGSSDHRPIVFITGLPRSGTTLLDRMLNAHPDIQVLEELEGLRITETATEEGATPAESHNLYWEFLNRHVDLDDSKLIVDKNPLHVMHLDMLPRVFPMAKTILVLRHPYDAALSCYMQDFDAGPVTARFHEIKSTAVLCAQFIKLMHQYESARPELTRRLYYENLVSGFQTEVTSLLDFIGLEWHEDIEHYAALAAKSNPIMTASYEQVTRGLYKTAVGRWRNYQQWLKPFDNILGGRLQDFGFTL